MNNIDIDQYLETIEISDVIKARICEFIEISQAVSSEDIVDIFISEYKTEDNHRELESIWAFTDKYLMEIKNFRTSDNIDIVNRTRGFQYLSVDFNNYNYVANETNVNSKMSIQAKFNETTTICILKSTGINCKYLKEIIEKYFKDLR